MQSSWEITQSWINTVYFLHFALNLHFLLISSVVEIIDYSIARFNSKRKGMLYIVKRFFFIEWICLFFFHCLDLKEYNFFTELTQILYNNIFNFSWEIVYTLTSYKMSLYRILFVIWKDCLKYKGNEDCHKDLFCRMIIFFSKRKKKI